jgi:hypothetical protein
MRKANDREPDGNIHDGRLAKAGIGGEREEGGARISRPRAIKGPLATADKWQTR